MMRASDLRRRAMRGKNRKSEIFARIVQRRHFSA